MWSRIIEEVAAWWSRRQARTNTPVPDLLEMRLEEARRAVKLEREKQELMVAKAETARMEAEQTIK